MKLLTVGLMAFGMCLSPIGASVPAFASADMALVCPPDAPEGWKRPGGYCEQRNTLDTIGTEKGNGVSACHGYADIGEMIMPPKGKAILVAIPYNPCCDTSMAAPLPQLPDGMLLRTDETILVSIC